MRTACTSVEARRAEVHECDVALEARVGAPVRREEACSAEVFGLPGHIRLVRA